jgi:hypothetical protein
LRKSFRKGVSMRTSDIRTSIVVHGTEIDTMSKLGDLYQRLERKLNNRVGYKVCYTVENRLIRNRIIWKSSRDCYEITLIVVMKNGKFVRDEWESVSDGERHNNQEYYSELEKHRKKRIEEVINRKWI